MNLENIEDVKELEIKELRVKELGDEVNNDVIEVKEKKKGRTPALVKAQKAYRQRRRALGITRTPKEKEAQERYRKKNMGREDVKEKKRGYAKTYYYKHREEVLNKKKIIRDKSKEEN